MERVPLGEETEAVDAVYLAQLAAGEEMSVQHFRIEPGATVPQHDHPHEQAGFVYEGELTFLVREPRSDSERASSAERSSAGRSSGRSPREDDERSEPREIVVRAGDSYSIPGGEPHAAENRGDSVVQGVDIFAPPRPNPDWME